MGEHPEWTQQVNHWGTAAVVGTALEAGVERFVHMSSASVYGPGERFRESAACRPVGPYAISKLEAEQEVNQAMERGLAGVILRLGTVFGTASAMRFDAVADRLTFRVGVHQPMVVHGSGEQRRPLIHIADACTAVRACLHEPEMEGEVFNAASVNPSINELVEILQEIEPKSEVRYTDQHVLTDLSLTIDSSKLEGRGWEPRTNLRDGLLEILGH